MTISLVPPPAAERSPLPTRSAGAVMRDVLFALYLREIKTRLDGRWRSIVWVIGEPLANLAVMLGLYGSLRARVLAGIDTLVFLITGVLSFLLFKSLVLRLMESIDANMGLFAYRQVQPIDAILSRAAVEVTLFAGMALVCLLGLGWVGHDIVPQRPLELIAATGLLVSFGVALGLLTAVGTGNTLNRLRTLVRLAFTPLYFLSGAVVPIASLPPQAQQVLLNNPVTHLIESIRSAFLGPVYQSAAGVNLELPLVWTLVTALLGLSLYRVRRHRLLLQ
jgi:capsular polysaccharide transport system permease protein